MQSKNTKKRKLLEDIGKQCFKKIDETNYMITNFDYCENDVNRHLKKNQHPEKNKRLLK